LGHPIGSHRRARAAAPLPLSHARAPAGISLAAVRDAAMAIRRIRPPNVYTGNGIRLLNENVKLRQRAGSK